MSERLLAAVVDDLRGRRAIEGWLVDGITVGDAAVLVELVEAGPRDDQTDRRVAGLAHRPPGEPSPEFSGETEATELLEPLVAGDSSVHSKLDRAVAIATLNALSAPHVDWQSGDPMAHLDPTVSTVVTVGLFRPAFRKFADVEVRVVEREPVDPATVSTPESVTVASFTPEETAAAMDGADVVFVTGSALVYGGVEQYVDAAPASATVVLVGATASMLPAPLFEAGIDVVAGAVVEAADRVRSAVSSGACGTDLHDSGVRKGFLSRTRTTELTPQRDTNDCT